MEKTRQHSFVNGAEQSVRRIFAISIALSLVAGAHSAAAREVLETPSGLKLAAPEVIFEPVGALASSASQVRLRYVAPLIADIELFGFDRLEGDFLYLCQQDGLKITTGAAPRATRVIVSIASVPLAFGETAPNITQYFDAFLIKENTCIWEGL
ncbi:MAG: DUF6497 family protein [Pseudomonadota bacterium]